MCKHIKFDLVISNFRVLCSLFKEKGKSEQWQPHTCIWWQSMIITFQNVQIAMLKKELQGVYSYYLGIFPKTYPKCLAFKSFPL